MADNNAEEIRRRRINRIAFWAVVCIALAMGTWAKLAQLDARWDYNRSRAYAHGGVDSFEFLSFGVAAGDTEAIVDQKLAGGAMMSGRGATAVNSLTTVKFYSFDYGHELFLPNGHPLLTERIAVYFDKDGQAEWIEHELFRDRSAKHRVNLRSRTVQRQE